MSNHTYIPNFSSLDRIVFPINYGQTSPQNTTFVLYYIDFCFVLIIPIGLLIRLTSGSSTHQVNFYSTQNKFNLAQWVPLIDMEDLEDFTDEEKMVLLDRTNISLLDSLTILLSNNFIVAVLCVCRSVTEKELNISADELTSGGYPPILFLLDKTDDVVKLIQMLILNPREVECSISADQVALKVLPKELSSMCTISTDPAINIGQRMFFSLLFAILITTSALRLLGRFAAEHNHTSTASRLVCGLYTS